MLELVTTFYCFYLCFSILKDNSRSLTLVSDFLSPVNCAIPPVTVPLEYIGNSGFAISSVQSELEIIFMKDIKLQGLSMLIPRENTKTITLSLSDF